MDGIPPPRDTDAEDVVWALQTAEALWKRNERGDAIVWVRRAAQAAGMTNDDDRALVLARGAAELTEWYARTSSASLEDAKPSDPPTSGEAAVEVEIDTLLRSSQVDPVELIPPNPAPASVETEPLAPVSLDSDALVSEAVPSLPSAPPVTLSVRPEVPLIPPPSPSRPSIRVLTAAESHAGMLDPWSDGAPESEVRAAPPPLPAAAEDPPVVVRRVEAPPIEQTSEFDEEVVTSARLGIALVSDRPPASPPGPLPVAIVEPSRKPPRPRAPRPAAPPPVRAAPVAPPEPARPAPAPAAPPPRAPVAEPAPVPPPVGGEAPAALDLSVVEAFADLPDDARDGLARAGRVARHRRGESLGPLALVFVVEGDVHVMASGVPTYASTLGPGAVLRARGTLDASIPLDLVCASEGCTVATWDEAAVDAALGPCPWVEDELRASGDTVQALAGATLGTLGQRLSPELRAGMMARLSLRPLEPLEILVTEGIPVPGILLVGAGSIELVANDLVTTHVSAGQFVLPAETLSAGPSPFSARAGAEGALVLAADRRLSQELFATEPLLLELFAGW